MRSAYLRAGELFEEPAEHLRAQPLLHRCENDGGGGSGGSGGRGVDSGELSCRKDNI